MTRKEISELFPIGATSVTPADLANAADAIQVIWAYMMTGLTLCDEIHPKTIADMVTPLAAASELASTTFTSLGWIAGTYGSRPDLYRHEDGPLNECTDMAATLLQRASEQQRALSNTLDDIGRFTSCMHLKDTKHEAAQQDS